MNAGAFRKMPGNTIRFSGYHYDLPRPEYLRLLRACDVGVFAPRSRRDGAGMRLKPS